MTINETAKAQPFSTHATSSEARPHAKKEATLWANFYERINDPVIAAIVIATLESDPKIHRAHAALHMRAKETVHRHEMRAEHYRTVGRFIGTATRYATGIVAKAYRNIVNEVSAAKHIVKNASRQDKSEPASTLDSSFDILVLDARVADSLHSLFVQRPDLIAQHPALYAKVGAVKAENLAKSA